MNNQEKSNAVVFALFVVMTIIAVFTSGCTEQQKIVEPKTWGTVDLPAHYVETFGDDNPSRLAYVTSTELDKIRFIVYGVNIKAEDGKVTRKRGLIERVTALEGKPSPPTQTVNWVGSPGVANWDGYFMNNGWLTGYKMGFRSDGAIVWKVNDPNEAKRGEK